MAYPMGEAKQAPLRGDFDRRLKLEIHGSKITSDAGGMAIYSRINCPTSKLSASNATRRAGSRCTSELATAFRQDMPQGTCGLRLESVFSRQRRCRSGTGDRTLASASPIANVRQLTTGTPSGSAADSR